MVGCAGFGASERLERDTASFTPICQTHLAEGGREHALRKTRGWKQDELGKKLGTSGVVVGRYERGEMMPSIEVAQKMAELFGVTVDYLVGEQGVPNLLSQSDMVERWATLDGLPPDDRDRILYVVDSLIREAKTRHAFGAR